MLCSNYSSLWSQSRLPMKDLTVGNRFVYYGYNASTTSTVAFYEEVVDEIYINGFIYGLVILVLPNV
jgi:hypothetical protein